jgi:hypothetical protein
LREVIDVSTLKLIVESGHSDQVPAGTDLERYGIQKRFEPEPSRLKTARDGVKQVSL